MSLSKIISIPGMSGLFKMVAQMRNGGFVVESLSDSKRFPVSSTQRIIMLEDISVYTMEDDMPLKEVFKRMKEQDALCSSQTARTGPEELKSTLKKVIPEFDEERVHASDIKKMFVWYNLLKDIIGTEEEEAEKQDSEPAEMKAEETAEEKSKKAKPAKAKAASAASAEKKADTGSAADGTEKKAKAPKKTTRKEPSDKNS
jgi:hypothetical protein